MPPSHLRRAIFATALVAVLFAPRPARAGDPDPWFGRDKALHFGVSVVLASGGYAVAAAFEVPRYARILTGAGFSLTLGAAKELWDLSGHGDPSWRDFTWDLIGTAVGVLAAWGVDLAVGGVGAAHPGAASPGGAPRGFALRF